MRGELEKLQNIGKPVRRPFSNGEVCGRGEQQAEGEERRQGAGVGSGDGLTAVRTPDFKDP